MYFVTNKNSTKNFGDSLGTIEVLPADDITGS